MPNSESNKLVDTQKLEAAVQEHLVPEIKPDDASDPVAIGNKIIRGLNQNTRVSLKAQHGVESLHERVSPLEQTVSTLVKRNEIVDEYLKIIAEAFTWAKEKLGWWVLQVIKLACLSLAWLIVSYVFQHFFHMPIPNSIEQ